MGNWSKKSLASLADYINGYAFKPHNWGNDGLPIIRIEQLKDDDAKCDYYKGDIPHYYIINNGDLIFSWSASLFLKIWTRGKAVLNQHLFKVENFEFVDRLFLKYLIEFNLPALTKAAHGSTMVHITRKELNHFEVYLPEDKNEQIQIAQVLAKIDKAIAQTDAVIEKNKRIKAGLIHDLLSNGIDENGNIRHEETHEFKDSPLGRIPVEWELAELENFAGKLNNSFVNGPFGSDLLAKELRSEGVPVIYIRDIKPNAYKRVSTVCVTPEKADALNFCNVKHGDVLISKVGDPPCDAAPYLLNEPAIITQDVIRIRPAKDVNTIFLSNLINSYQAKKAIDFIAIQGTRKRVSLTDFKKIILPKPPLTEQNKIVSVLEKQDKLILNQIYQRNKLQSLKKGLMDDLLMGKVSVNQLVVEQEITTEFI